MCHLRQVVAFGGEERCRMAIDHDERAGRAWPILVKLAHARKCAAYGTITAQLGVHHRAAAWFLGRIQHLCDDEGLPALQSVVVNAKKGIPGPGYDAAFTPKERQKRLDEVFDFDWSKVKNPFAWALRPSGERALAARLRRDLGSAHDVWKLAKTRDARSRIFRLAVGEAYDWRCAFCALRLRAALEAAHIVPWGKASPRERMDVTNGVLLCATHHKLFDTWHLTIDTKRRVRMGPALGPVQGVSYRATRSLDGAPVAAPVDDMLRPALRYLRRRAALAP
jgi:putative restriction endonuclease